MTFGRAFAAAVFPVASRRHSAHAFSKENINLLVSVNKITWVTASPLLSKDHHNQKFKPETNRE
jgi:hypothetical protein